MNRVGFVGWRGMVGSVLLERMREENDFAAIDEPVFFTTSQVGQAGPEIGKPVPTLQDALDIEALAKMDAIVTCQGGDYTKRVFADLRGSGWKGYWIDAASALRMQDDSVIVLDPVNLAIDNLRAALALSGEPPRCQRLVTIAGLQQQIAQPALVLAARLAECKGASATAQVLARETGIPQPTVVKLLKILTAAGLTRSTQGRRGGYALARPARRIGLTEIIETVEGPIALTQCSHRSDLCGIQDRCVTHRHWPVINRALREALAPLVVRYRQALRGTSSARRASGAPRSSRRRAVSAAIAPVDDVIRRYEESCSEALGGKTLRSLVVSAARSDDATAPKRAVGE